MHQIESFCALPPQGPAKSAPVGEEVPLVMPKRRKPDSTLEKVVVVEEPAWMKPEEAVAAARGERAKDEEEEEEEEEEKNRMEVYGTTEAVGRLASELEGSYEDSRSVRVRPKDAMALEAERDGVVKRLVDRAVAKTSPVCN